MKKKYICLIIILCLLIPCITSCDKPHEAVSKTGFYFDTLITITLYDNKDNKILENYIDDCFMLAGKYEKMFSNTVKDSEISQLNNSAGISPVTVSDETLSLIQTGLKYGDLSDGRFDITIGPLSELWNISEIAKNLATEHNEADASLIPSNSDINEALTYVDYKDITIANNDVMLNKTSAKLDLGGIAKGYIADKIKEYLVSCGVSSGIINLGGNILTIGTKPDGTNYNVGIQKPFDETGASIAAIPIADKSVVTSGIYERYFYVDDQIYHHLLDTKTGYPYNNELNSVTIISDYSVDGDALSTTCFALGLDAGMKLIEATDNIEAIFIDKDNNIYPSSGIKDLINTDIK